MPGAVRSTSQSNISMETRRPNKTKTGRVRGSYVAWESLLVKMEQGNSCSQKVAFYLTAARTQSRPTVLECLDRCNGCCSARPISHQPPQYGSHVCPHAYKMMDSIEPDPTIPRLCQKRQRTDRLIFLLERAVEHRLWTLPLERSDRPPSHSASPSTRRGYDSRSRIPDGQSPGRAAQRSFLRPPD